MRLNRSLSRTMGVGPATIPVVLTLGAQPYDDQVLIFGLGFRYLIGPQE